MANGKIGKFIEVAGRWFGGANRLLHRLITLAIVALIFGIVYFTYDGIRNGWSVVSTPFARLTGSTPIPAQLSQKVSDDRLKCRAYTMLADFEGSARRLEDDKLRILRTVANYSATQGVDECEIFHKQMELVAPGWGQRKVFGVLDVPDRTFGYIESTFSESARNVALALAKDASEHPNLSWPAIAIIRPARTRTVGNQKADEIQKILDTLDEVAISPSDFRFFKLKTVKP